MSSTVSFRLNDPGELLKVLEDAKEYAATCPSDRPIIYQNSGGVLCYAWSKQNVDPRHDVSLGYVRYRKSDNTLTLVGRFFGDCEDEVAGVCEQLGVRCEVNP